MTKIPGTESTTITTPEDFQRYAKAVADNPSISPEIAGVIVTDAARFVRWPHKTGAEWAEQSTVYEILSSRTGQGWNVFRWLGTLAESKEEAEKRARKYLEEARRERPDLRFKIRRTTQADFE